MIKRSDFEEKSLKFHATSRHENGTGFLSSDNDWNV